VRTSRLRHLFAAAAVVAAAALCLPSGAGARATGSGALPEGFFGVSPATRLSDDEFARMGAGAVGTLRTPFFWEDIQPITRLHFDWSKTDRVVTGAALNGISVLPYVMGVPRWLRDSSGSSDHPPLDQRGREAWTELLARLVKRYGPGGEFWSSFSVLHPGAVPRPITAWQISNEPNDSSYSRPVETAPERYAELLMLSSQVIKARDPGASVISAGVFGTPGHGTTAWRFLSRMYKVPGVAGAFDALAVHPYAGDLKGVVYQIERARRIMARNGDAAKPMWITELGWPTLDEVGNGFSTTERGQKRLLVRTFNRVIRERPSWRVDKIVWYTWRDNSLFANCNLCRSSGLFRKDLTPKPSWAAFVGFTGGSADTPPDDGGGLPIELPLP
jgi:hypothetical protein